MKPTAAKIMVQLARGVCVLIYLAAIVGIVYGLWRFINWWAQ